jgi:adenine-specific DNA-methyltransferase
LSSKSRLELTWIGKEIQPRLEPRISTENDFIYVTTQTLTRYQLAALSEEVGEGRSLLVCCAAFQGKADDYPDLTLKKIPKVILNRCEWGRDDYSLAVLDLPMAPAQSADAKGEKAATSNEATAGLPLFDYAASE